MSKSHVEIACRKRDTKTLLENATRNRVSNVSFSVEVISLRNLVKKFPLLSHLGRSLRGLSHGLGGGVLKMTSSHSIFIFKNFSRRNSVHGKRLSKTRCVNASRFEVPFFFFFCFLEAQTWHTYSLAS